MQKRYPFKFLDAYTREDKDISFGRKEEVERLYEMVFQADLLLVYGASGTGKTSLIQCGLASKFQSHDWLSLNIRRGSNLNESLDEALRAAAGDAPSEELGWLHEDRSSEQPASAEASSLSPLARRFKAIYLQHFKTIYLIFDQFEELYLLGNKAEEQAFVKTVQEALRVKQPVKLIISIREEYLGHLYEFERQVSDLLRKKLRVEPMNLDKVKTVIRGVGSLPQSNVRLQAGEEAAVAEAVFHKIRGSEKALSIQLPYLQVFLDKYYLHCTGDESRRAEEIARLEVQRLIRSQVAIKAEAREFFTGKQLDFIQPFLPNLRLSEEEQGWIRESEPHRAEREEAEERRQRQELEKAQRQAAIERDLADKANAALAELRSKNSSIFSEAVDRGLASRPPYRGRFGDHPVVSVSWYEAAEYANWLNAQQGWPPCYDIQKGKNSSPNNQV